MFFTSHENIVEVIIFSWSMLLMKLNSCEDEWLVGMGVLQEEKNKATKATQKKKG